LSGNYREGDHILPQGGLQKKRTTRSKVKGVKEGTSTAQKKIKGKVRLGKYNICLPKNRQQFQRAA